MADYNSDKPISRENFPLEVGDEITINGQTAVFVDYPTDGPLFEIPGEEPGFKELQLELEEFLEIWE